MEEAARRYARKILLIHLLVFVVLMAFVVVTAQEVYERSRDEAMDQARARQALLLNQTAKGIESFYHSIFSDMELLRRADEGEVTVPDSPMRQSMVSSLLWKQLEGRASNVFIYDKSTGLSRLIGADAVAISPDTIVSRSKAWLDSVTSLAISKFQQSGASGYTLVCMPNAAKNKVLVAIVVVDEIDKRFMQEVNKQAKMGVTLLDENLATMATSNKAMVGRDILRIPDPSLQAAVTEIVKRGEPASLTVDKAINFGGIQLEPAIINAQPIHLQGKTWWCYIATATSEIDDNVLRVFRRAAIWACIAIVGMTALLVSTSVVLIKGRVRLERMRHDMLRKELDQARDIQLAWLPAKAQARNVNKAIDLAALNVPASHISGDFYNWFELPDGRTVVTIGDVTGHGMAAAFLMATTQLLVRTTMPRVGDPGKCLEEVNRQLCVQVFNGQFVTMSILVLDIDAGVVDIASAGHPAPLLCDGSTYESLAIDPELVLGVEADAQYPTRRFQLPPGSGLLLYTDGVPDAMAPDETRLGINGLRKSLFGRYESAQALLDATVRIVDEFRQTQALADDLTLVAIQLVRTDVETEQPVGA